MHSILFEEDQTHNKYKSVIESLLFAWAEPLSLYKIAKILDLKPGTVETLIEEMMKAYVESHRGIQIIETNKHYQFSTLKANYPFVEQLCATSKSKGLSNSALEVLAIVAYKQPITKLDIEQIRGVNSEGPLQSLIERDLVEVKGKLEKIGRPQIFGTTDAFLRSFGFKSLGDLPLIEEFKGFVHKEAIDLVDESEAVEAIESIEAIEADAVLESEFEEGSEQEANYDSV